MIFDLVFNQRLENKIGTVKINKRLIYKKIKKSE